MQNNKGCSGADMMAELWIDKGRCFKRSTMRRLDSCVVSSQMMLS